VLVPAPAWIIRSQAGMGMVIGQLQHRVIVELRGRSGDPRLDGQPIIGP
jgi:hypothetical protein